MNTALTNVYKGNCHCGANRFELTVPEIISATGCDCSLCFQNQLLWAFPANEQDLKVTRGDQSTSVSYSSAALEIEFCSRCGILFRGKHIAGPLKNIIGINVRTLLNVNPYKVEAITSDCKAHELPPHAHPAFAGADPSFEGENLRTYTGSCHCGAIRIAVKTPPLASGVEVKEDNCSICVRTGLTQIYPDKDQVSITGTDKTIEYLYGRKFGGHPFCATCGGKVYTNVYGPPQSVVDRLPDAKKEFVKKQLRIQPVNVRALAGVEWDEIEVKKTDEGTEGYIPED